MCGLIPYICQCKQALGVGREMWNIADMMAFVLLRLSSPTFFFTHNTLKSGLCVEPSFQYAIEEESNKCQNFARIYQWAYAIESVKETKPTQLWQQNDAKYLLVGVKSLKSNMNEQVEQSFSIQGACGSYSMQSITQQSNKSDKHTCICQIPIHSYGPMLANTSLFTVCIQINTAPHNEKSL